MSSTSLLENNKPEIIVFKGILPNNTAKGINYLTRNNIQSFLKQRKLAQIIRKFDIIPFEKAIRTELKIPARVFEEEHEKISRGKYSFLTTILPNARKSYQGDVIKSLTEHLGFKLQESEDGRKPHNIITKRRFKYYDAKELVEKVTFFAEEGGFKKPGLSLQQDKIVVKDKHLLKKTPNNIINEENIFRYFNAQHNLNILESCTKGFKASLKANSERLANKELGKNPNLNYVEITYVSRGGLMVVHPGYRIQPWAASYKNLFIKPGLEQEFLKTKNKVSKSELGELFLLYHLAKSTNYDEPSFYASLNNSNLSSKTVQLLNPVIAKKKLRAHKEKPEKRLLLSTEGIETLMKEEIKKQKDANKKFKFYDLKV